VTALESVYNDPEPVCYISGLGGDGAEFKMRFYHDFEVRIATRDEVAQTIIDTLLAAGIKLGTPELIVYRGQHSGAEAEAITGDVSQEG